MLTLTAPVLFIAAALRLFGHRARALLMRTWIRDASARRTGGPGEQLPAVALCYNPGRTLTASVAGCVA